MTFDLGAIAILVLGAGLYAGLVPGRWRSLALFIGSILVIFWLQPPLPVRYGGYILPTVTLVLTVITWWLTRPTEARALTSDDVATLLLGSSLVVGISFLRFTSIPFNLSLTQPPSPLAVGVVLVLVATVAVPLYRFRRHYAMQGLLTGWLLILVALFIVLKTEPLATQLSRWWRLQAGQDLTLAGIVDLRWLGFSYVAFRLIHTVRDRQLGILPAFSLRDYVTYVIFFPAYVAGPIDRAEHFVPALQRLPELAGFAAARWSEGLARIAIGVGKKFVVADSLGYFSLDPARAAAATSPAGLWLLLYAYSLRLYLDFSGYTDIAIGLGLLFGVRLPENFRWPYLQTDLNRFWHTWHITLGDWVRLYVFSPLSRALLRRQPRPSPVLVMLFAQLVTMITIGLWHGITLAFFVWGLWHGIGLFIHKQWSRYSRPWQQRLQPRGRKVWTGISWFITFQYVTLGWVWFALPDAGQAVRTFGRLAGLGW